MKTYGEDIIQTKTGELAAMREKAKKLSKSKNHSWANIFYIDTQRKKLTSETFTEGKLYGVNRDQLKFPGDGWFTSKLTILEAMLKFSECNFITKNTERILRKRNNGF
jgi:hypothetical protein